MLTEENLEKIVKGLPLRHKIFMCLYAFWGIITHPVRYYKMKREFSKYEKQNKNNEVLS